MSLTLVLVSFSCTGPILGTLLVGSISGDGGSVDLTYGMLGFGIALSVPFTLLAFFQMYYQTTKVRFMDEFCKSCFRFYRVSFSF